MAYDRTFLEKANRLYGSADFEDVLDQRLAEIMDEIVTLHPIIANGEIVATLFKYHALEEFREFVKQCKHDLENMKNA